jgi:hypothetical protein
MSSRLAAVGHLCCFRLQRHPTALFWLLTCAAYLAGALGSLLSLALILLIEVALVVHLVNRTYRQRKDVFDGPKRASRGRRRPGDQPT